VKKLYWNSFRLAPGLDTDTVWDAVAREDANVNTADLEVLFADAGPSPAAPKEEKLSKTPRVRRIQVLGCQRRRQISVLLPRLPPPKETCDAILDIDILKLNKEQVELLSQNAPSQEEVQLLQQAEREHVIDDSNKWDSAEEFMFLLLSIPCFKLRLQIWNFENSFQEHFNAILEAQDCIQRGCSCMFTSQSIRRTLGIILVVGNYLNGGTPRGRADGFAADTLAQMRMLRMSRADRPGTLVDYLVQQMESQYPGELEVMLAPDGLVGCIRRAARRKQEDISEELRSLKAKAEAILHMIRSSQASEDCALAQHGEIMAMSVAELEGLELRDAKLDRTYAELCRWFHMEDSSTRKTSSVFFGIWDAFLQDVEKARDALQAQGRQAEARRRIRSNSAVMQRGVPPLPLNRGRSQSLVFQPSQPAPRLPTTPRTAPSPPWAALGTPRRPSGVLPALPSGGPASEEAAQAARGYVARLVPACAALAATGPCHAAAALAARSYVAELLALQRSSVRGSGGDPSR